MIKVNAFSLLELLITLSILGIVLVIGTPMLSVFIEQNEKKSLVNEIRRIIQYTKSQAVIQGSSLVLSPINEKTLNWSEGIVLKKHNIKTNKMDVLYQWDWNYHYWNVVWSGTNASSYISISNNSMSAISNGTFIVASKTNMKDKVSIVLNRIGRVRVVENLNG